MADVRRAVRDALAVAIPDARAAVTRDPGCGTPGGWVVPADAPVVLVALSGGPDSLGLAAALGFEAAKCGVRAGAVIVDHALQPGSADVAARAAEQAGSLGLAPVVIERVDVTATKAGPEADARTARYAALNRVAHSTGAVAVLLGHTLDDQAETVLLGLARGSGARSLSGMRVVSTREGSPLLLVRPLLGVRRETVAQSCADQELGPWIDPHNSDATYARVRVRTTVLPVLESELGPGVAEALARTASQLSDDADALDALAATALAETLTTSGNLSVSALANAAAAIRRRVIHAWLQETDGPALAATHIEAVDSLITNWTGQSGIDLPGLRVRRVDGELTLDTA
jgi:tRNA(Ile)-lysidine synthase